MCDVVVGYDYGNHWSIGGDTQILTTNYFHQQSTFSPSVSIARPLLLIKDKLGISRIRFYVYVVYC